MLSSGRPIHNSVCRVGMTAHSACNHVAQHEYGSQGRWGNYALTWEGNY